MPLETLAFIIIALLAGAGYPLQAGINATLSGIHGHPLLAAFTNMTVGSVVLLTVVLVLRVPAPQMAALASAPWWAWTGGCLGGFFVLSSLMLAPKLGAAAFVSTTIVGTMVASLVIDHFGLLVYRAQPITLLRLFGAVLVVSGMIMIQWRR